MVLAWCNKWSRGEQAASPSVVRLRVTFSPLTAGHVRAWAYESTTQTSFRSVRTFLQSSRQQPRDTQTHRDRPRYFVRSSGPHSRAMGAVDGGDWWSMWRENCRNSSKSTARRSVGSQCREAASFTPDRPPDHH